MEVIINIITIELFDQVDISNKTCRENLGIFNFHLLYNFYEAQVLQWWHYHNHFPVSCDFWNIKKWG